MSSLIGGFLQQLIHGGPDEPPPVPVFKKPESVPVAPKKIPEPSAPPTEGVETSNAYKADERRRILGALPKPTKTEYAGDKYPMRKSKVLGGDTGQRSLGV